MRRRIFAIFIFICTIVFSSNAINNPINNEKTQPVDSLQQGMLLLKRFAGQQEKWFFNNPEFGKSIRGLIHFIEDEQLDTILYKIGKYKNDSILISRRWQDVPDTLTIQGFMPAAQIKEKMKKLDREIRDQNPFDKIPVPEYLLTGIEKKVSFISKENAQILIDRRLLILPDSLKSPSQKTETLKPGSKKYLQQQRLDSVRANLIEQARIKYNDSLLRHYVDSVSTEYRETALSQFSDSLQKQLSNSLKWNNIYLVKKWNDSFVASVNDSIKQLLPYLERQAYKYPSDVWLHNLSNDSILIRTHNGENYFTRMFIKNEQKDSLGVKIENLGRNSIKILIDDGITFTRFKEQQKRETKFANIAPESKLIKVASKYNIITPWNLGSTSTFGFTQTSLSNWKKGGNSSLSILTVLKGYANYSDKKLKWENSAEIRNGWMRINDEHTDTKLQKNDDKLELITRLGVSAFKKWYYSSEIDFETQFFRGYNYPDTDHPISAFMAPAKTLIKIGLDYKPTKDFSLFLSPLTSKTVFVRDTALIDQTKFGVNADKQRFWEPGFNADLKYKKTMFKDIVWETKYKMFFNYRSPFEKLDISWENQVSMKLNDYINMNFMLHLIYDDNITFATDKLDSNGQTIYKPKWQVKELITIGFAYNINRRIYKRQQVK